MAERFRVRVVGFAFTAAFPSASVSMKESRPGLDFTFELLDNVQLLMPVSRGSGLPAQLVSGPCQVRLDKSKNVNVPYLGPRCNVGGVSC